MLALIRLLSFVPLLIVAIGFVGNLTAFLIFTFNSNMNQMSSMIFLSFVSIADTFSLFVWNLNHFFLPNYSFRLENLNVYSCKILSFVQFSSLQLSGLLHALISIDRYFTIISTRRSTSPQLFGRPKSAFVWSVLLTTAILLVNAHLIIFNGYWQYERFTNNTDKYNSVRVTKELSMEIANFLCYYSQFYEIVPLWNRVHMIIYNLIPFVLMIIFNSLLIKRTFYTRVHRFVNTIHTFRRRRLTVSLLFITFGFIVMTLPATLIFGFFYAIFFSFPLGEALAMLADFVMFFQHSSIFFTCYLTNYKFRAIVQDKLKMFRKRHRHSAILNLSFETCHLTGENCSPKVLGP